MPDARHTQQIEAHGLSALEVQSRESRALIFLQGAHVASFRHQSHGELLWMSERSLYAPGKALRGGVPICFPWFGPHPSRSELPAHGFARTREFEWRGSEERDGVVTLEFALTADALTRAAFPESFRAHYRVQVGAELSLEFEVENTGQEALAYDLALHTYLGVADVREVELRGLEAAHYYDKVAGSRMPASGAPLRLSGETDRVYDSAGGVSVSDVARGRRLMVEKAGSPSTVIWNPWAEKSAKMSDMSPVAWETMLCVEAANALAGRVVLEPSARHVTRTVIGAAAL